MVNSIRYWRKLTAEEERELRLHFRKRAPQGAVEHWSKKFRIDKFALRNALYDLELLIDPGYRYRRNPRSCPEGTVRPKQAEVYDEGREPTVSEYRDSEID